jgi:uroporphyrinogen-III synthase
MPSAADRPSPLQGWTVLSIRPRGQHAGLRSAAARRGAGLLALSPVAIEPHADPATRAALAEALRADVVVYTSPNAVAAAAALRSLRRGGHKVLAVGDGTRRALLRHGVDATAPARMDSEGLLAMPALAAVAGRRVGLVTGAGGRNLLAPALHARGAQVLRADVYARSAVPLSTRACEGLRDALADAGRVVLALGSREALQRLLDGVPGALRTRLAGIAVVAASARLADTARSAGFRRVAVAVDARPASLMRAAAEAFD